MTQNDYINQLLNTVIEATYTRVLWVDAMGSETQADRVTAHLTVNEDAIKHELETLLQRVYDSEFSR